MIAKTTPRAIQQRVGAFAWRDISGPNARFLAPSASTAQTADDNANAKTEARARRLVSASALPVSRAPFASKSVPRIGSASPAIAPVNAEAKAQPAGQTMAPASADPEGPEADVGVFVRLRGSD